MKETTLSSYKTYIDNHVIPNIGWRQLKNLKTEHIQTIYNELLKNGISPKTIRKLHIIINQSLDDAVAQQLISINVAKQCKLPTIVDKEIKIMSKSEKNKLLEKLNNIINNHINKCVDSSDISVKNAIAIKFVLFTGLRVSELIGLCWQDIDFDKMEIKIKQIIVRIKDPAMKGKTKLVSQTPKTKSALRTIPFTENIKKDLLLLKDNEKISKQLYGDAYIDNGLVFSTSIGTPTEARNLDRALESICKKIGIARYNMHSLRHTFASDLISKGCNVKAVQYLMGHKVISTTLDLYGHAYPEDIKSSIEKLHDEN